MLGHGDEQPVSISSVPLQLARVLSTSQHELTGGHLPSRRDAAVAAGAVAALCTTLGSGEEEPVSINILRALYNLAGPAGSQAITMELFASGGVHALVR